MKAMIVGSLQGERATKKLRDPSFKLQERKQLQKQLLQTEDERMKKFAETDTIRLDLNTIERLIEAEGMGQSWSNVINRLLDRGTTTINKISKE
jgi:hypothetical protein